MAARLKHEVCLITGALGSGKTTLLNRLLQCQELSGSMVLINEFGDIGLDHEIVREVKEDVLLLSSGCLCCSLKGDLQDELTAVVESLTAGEIKIKGPIIIETTGIADPVPILQLINTDEVLSCHLIVNHVITVIDTLRCHRQVEEFPEIDSQIALADLLVLSKTDLASVADQTRVISLISRLNPLSKRFEITRTGEIQDLVSAILQRGDEYDLPVELPARHGHRNLIEIDSFAFEFEGRVSHGTFFQWVQFLIQSLGERLLRMKGVIAFADGSYSVHSTGPLFYPPEPLGSDASQVNGRLICIGRGLERFGIERSFRQMCLGEPVPRRELDRCIRLNGNSEPIYASTYMQVHSRLAEVFTHEALTKVSSFHHWDVHNPWSVSAQYFDAWSVLEVCENPELVAQITGILGPNINLIGSELITQDTYWLSQSRGIRIADEARYLPVDPDRSVACRIPIYGLDAYRPGTIHQLSVDWICPDTSRDWACLTLYFADSDVLFDRSNTHPANICCNLERPLANSAAMPIWLVSGHDQPGNNYAIGFNRPRPEWLQTQTD